MKIGVLLLVATFTSVNSAGDVNIVLGNGCYWALQYLIVNEFEMRTMNRTDNEITTITGYAGGVPSPELCYHNANNAFDYGSLGHAEAVQVTVPNDPVALEKLARIFFNDSFVQYPEGSDSRNVSRPDVYDVGAEYRALLGIPGGMEGILMSPFLKANRALHNMTLLAGSGSDPDTIDDDSVLVYDTNNFKFTQAELCMQFHDDPPGVRGPFPPEYGALRSRLTDAGRLHPTKCPPNFVCGSRRGALRGR